VNLATNSVISNEIYFLIFNFYASLQRSEIEKLSEVMGNQHIIDSKLSLSALNVKA
jgi:hypothetical protein